MFGLSTLFEKKKKIVGTFYSQKVFLRLLQDRWRQKLKSNVWKVLNFKFKIDFTVYKIYRLKIFTKCLKNCLSVNAAQDTLK